VRTGGRSAAGLPFACDSDVFRESKAIKNNSGTLPPRKLSLLKKKTSRTPRLDRIVEAGAATVAG
jgi:hypothetical protein